MNVATLASVLRERARLRSLLALADERERALALVLLDTGLRLSELASLRVGDVRPDDRHDPFLGALAHDMERPATSASD
jgi:integrase